MEEERGREAEMNGREEALIRRVKYETKGGRKGEGEGGRGGAATGLIHFLSSDGNSLPLKS